MTNLYQLVEREVLAGDISGIDFGYKVCCLARSPRTALLWSGGGGCWSGRGQPYAYHASQLIAFYRPENPRLHYEYLGTSGGRLSERRIRTSTDYIAGKLFANDEVVDWIVAAVRQRKTLLIEGGGSQFRLKRP